MSINKKKMNSQSFQAILIFFSCPAKWREWGNSMLGFGVLASGLYGGTCALVISRVFFVEISLHHVWSPSRQVADRNRAARNSSAHVRLTTDISKLLKSFSRDIANLKSSLRQTSLSVTGRELQRREALVDALVTKERQIEDSLKAG